MKSYVVALGAWLLLPPRLWCERLLNVSPRDWGWPGHWVAVVLAAALVHCLGRPLDVTSNVAGELLGGVFTVLRHARSCPPPPPAPAISHLRGPHPLPVSRWCCLHGGACG